MISVSVVTQGSNRTTILCLAGFAWKLPQSSVGWSIWQHVLHG